MKRNIIRIVKWFSYECLNIIFFRVPARNLYSLESNLEGITEEVSQELWHSLNLDESIVVNIEVGPGVVEVLIEE